MIGFVGLVGDFEVRNVGAVSLLASIGAMAKVSSGPLAVPVDVSAKINAQGKLRFGPDVAAPLQFHIQSQAKLAAAATVVGALLARISSQGKIQSMATGSVDVLASISAQTKMRFGFTGAVPIAASLAAQTKAAMAVTVTTTLSAKITTQAKAVPYLTGAVDISSRIIGMTKASIGQPELPLALAARIQTQGNLRSHISGVLDLIGITITTMTKIIPGLTGETSLAAVLTGQTKARAQEQTSLALRLIIQGMAKMRGHAQGVVPILARVTSQTKAAGHPTGTVALPGAKITAQTKARATPTGLAAMLATIKGMMTGRSAPTGVAAMRARVTAQTKARSALTGVVSIASKITAQAKATATASPAVLLAMRIVGQAKLAGDLRGQIIQLLATITAQTKARAALPVLSLALRASFTAQTKARSFVRLLRFSTNYVTKAPARYLTAGTIRSLNAIAALRSMVAMSDERGRDAIAAPRVRIVLGERNSTMSQAPTLEPPIDSTVEEEFITFDYVSILDHDAGEILTGVLEVTCKVFTGTDASASSRLIGSASIVASPSCADRPASAVVQMVGNMVGGVTYVLQCLAETSTGQKLSIWTYFSCVTPPGN